jgi:histone deacetylase 6
LSNTLLSTDSKFKIRSIVNFVTGSLRPIKSETDPNLSSWYKQHSRVYVASDHACWADEVYSTKVRKSRFGRVVKSEAVGLNRMMALHREEAMAWILDSLGESDSMETE